MTKKGSVCKRSEYFSKFAGAFRDTKFDKRYWKILGVDFVFTVIRFAIFGIALYFAFSYLGNFMPNLGGVEVSEDPSQILLLLAPFLKILVFVGLITGLVSFLVSTAFKGWIWRIIFNKKMNLKFYWRFIGFRVIAGIMISLVFMLLVLFGSFYVNAFLSILFVLAGVLLVHLFAVSLIYFVKSNEIKQSIKRGFKEGIRVHLFLLPYLFFLALLVVRSFINQIVQLITGAPAAYENFQELIANLLPYLQSAAPYMIVTIIIGLFFIAYMRIWYAEFVDRL